MKTIIKYISLVIFLVLTACEDVVDIDVQEGPTRLVIEASLDWEKGTEGNYQTIKLSTSTPYFDTSFQPAIGATVSVLNVNSGTEVLFVDQNDGNYTTTDFEPVIGDTYALTVNYKNEVFTATEKMTPVPEIKEVFQSRDDGFNDEDLEVHLVFTDPEAEENYYLFKFLKEGELFPAFEDAKDEFINGNEIDWWYEIEEDEMDGLTPFEPGDTVYISMHGISKSYYEYIKILIEQMGGAGLFSSTPVALKGNCVNQTKPENQPLGYFRLTEVNKVTYTFTAE
ncbi:DUF4249 domain-containing protein [Muricauda ruestringensis]|uniref:DUF4249 domain-containing protein n=1 Tax=Flagellimonas marinaquae TaxID=254955 RepID=A0AA48KQB6_9FLAO|nr:MULTISPECIES: DUF4249 domain-containing protein [Allomuricauda]MCA0959622.1 DUF4249 domain-containing protein [Allomuricauda ruestringensis]USD25044.1 DUF4249 domain-containing protein [Allomuricauda aquimarina]BDW94055.1 hypothetical protein MACH07_28870 [Allomuricauda aquimarina]